MRLDKTGILYCSSSYLNYKVTELAKALLLFSEPSTIDRTDTKSIDYFKAYGANLYGGAISKKYMDMKVKWIDENTD